MASKKTNYISYEIKKLEGYIQQLQSYLDKNPADDIEVQLDVRYSTNGNPIVKVIASKESQLKAFRDTLEKLPKLLEDLNRLRKIADTGDAEVVDKARGDKELPGLFKSRMLGNTNVEKKDEVEEVEIIEAVEEEDDVWEED